MPNVTPYNNGNICYSEAIRSSCLVASRLVIKIQLQEFNMLDCSRSKLERGLPIPNHDVGLFQNIKRYFCLFIKHRSAWVLLKSRSHLVISLDIFVCCVGNCRGYCVTVRYNSESVSAAYNTIH